MRVLICDDSLAMRMIVKRTLRQAGFESLDVEQAENGAQGLAMVKANPPDLVLCDWNMPEMTGIEFLEALNKGGIKVKFGFVTSEGTPEMRAIARNAGALFVITKPFTPEVFAEHLTPILAG